MTSQGTEAGQLNRAFDHAIRTGDLRMALATAADLPFVSLERAARILHLMARDHSKRYDRAGARWISRYVTEVPDVTPETILDVAEALAEMPSSPQTAEVLILAVSKRA